MKNSKTRSGAHQCRGEALETTGDGLSAGSRILAAIEEATELLRLEGLESRRLTVRTYQVPQSPRATLAYYRVPREHIVPVGRATWVTE